MKIIVNVDDSILEEKVIDQLCRDIVSHYFHVSSNKLDTELPKRLARKYRDFINNFFDENKDFLEEAIKKSVSSYLVSSATVKNGRLKAAIDKVFAEMEEEDNE